MSDPTVGPDALADAYRELARRQASGEITPELEAELDRAFAAVAPPGAVGGDGRLLIELAAERSSIHPHAPVDAGSPVGVFAKRAVRKATFWYVAWLADAIADFAGTITQALRLVEARVRRLESLVAPGGSSADALASAAAGPPPAEAVAVVGQRLAEVEGAIAITHDPAGVLRDALAEPHAGPRVVLDALPDPAAGLVAAVVLVGVVDRSPASAVVELAERAARVLQPAGRLLVVSADPEAPLSDQELVARELGGGRPLSSPTWRHLLGAVGLVDIEVETVPGGFVASARRPS